MRIWVFDSAWYTLGVSFSWISCRHSGNWKILRRPRVHGKASVIGVGLTSCLFQRPWCLSESKTGMNDWQLFYWIFVGSFCFVAITISYEYNVMGQNNAHLCGRYHFSIEEIAFEPNSVPSFRWKGLIEIKLSGICYSKCKNWIRG